MIQVLSEDAAVPLGLLFTAALLLRVISLPVIPLNPQSPPWRNQAVWPEQTTIRHVSFENVTRLSVHEQYRLRQKIQAQHPCWQDRPDEISDLVAQMVEKFYMDRGYVKVRVTANVKRVAFAAQDRLFDAKIRVLNEGEQYRLSAIRWNGLTVFTEERLRNLMPIRAGELCSSEKVVASLDAARQLYGSRGYINFTGVPDMESDDVRHSINLKIDVFEGEQYRFGDLLLPGLDAEHTHELREGWKELKGQPFSPQTLELFFGKHFHPASNAHPLKYTEYTDRLTDHATRTVNVMIRFVPKETPILVPFESGKVTKCNGLR